MNLNTDFSDSEFGRREDAAGDPFQSPGPLRGRLPSWGTSRDREPWPSPHHSVDQKILSFVGGEEVPLCIFRYSNFSSSSQNIVVCW